MASFSKVDDNLMQIPPELMQFVKRDTYSLLVKGNSGTGKTTLSLTILRALEESEVISFTYPPGSLRGNFL